MPLEPWDQISLMWSVKHTILNHVTIKCNVKFVNCSIIQTPLFRRMFGSPRQWYLTLHSWWYSKNVIFNSKNEYPLLRGKRNLIMWVEIICSYTAHLYCLNPVVLWAKWKNHKRIYSVFLVVFTLKLYHKLLWRFVQTNQWLYNNNHKNPINWTEFN